MHAAVIKGLGRGTSSGASTDAGAGFGADRGLVLVLAVRTPSKQWREYLECLVRVPEAGAHEISASKTSAILLSIFSSPFSLRDYKKKERKKKEKEKKGEETALSFV